MHLEGGTIYVGSCDEGEVNLGSKEVSEPDARMMSDFLRVGVGHDVKETQEPPDEAEEIEAEGKENDVVG